MTFIKVFVFNPMVWAEIWNQKYRIMDKEGPKYQNSVVPAVVMV